MANRVPKTKTAAVPRRTPPGSAISADLRVVALEKTKRAMLNILEDLSLEKHIADGRVLELESTKRAMLNIMEDLTEEKRYAETEKMKFATALAGIADAVIVSSPAREIIFANTVAEKLLGVTKESLNGKNFYYAVKWEDEAGASVATDAYPITIATKEKVVSRKTLWLRGQGGYRYAMRVVASPLISSGRLVGVVSVWHDMTEEFALDRAKTEFVSLASHQLRTPLTAINWYAEAAASGDYGDPGESLREPIRAIHESAQRMSRLINALLNVSRIEMGRLRIKPEPLELASIAREVVGELTPQTSAKKLRISIAAAPTLTRISYDRSLLKIVYQNIISNAVKYTRTGGRVSISIEPAGADMLTTVADDGIGIPTEQQPKIFQKLFRANNVQTVETDGTGLGLYIAKAVVEQFGGKIWFSSELGVGTTFHFTLPLSGVAERQGPQTLIAET